MYCEQCEDQCGTVVTYNGKDLCLTCLAKQVQGIDATRPAMQLLYNAAGQVIRTQGQDPGGMTLTERLQWVLDQQPIIKSESRKQKPKPPPHPKGEPITRGG